MPSQFPVLVIDDDPLISDMLNRAARGIFDEAHFIAIHSFEEAASYLDGLRGRGPKLVLLDINLQSSLNGLDFLTMLRAHPQGRLVPVIVLSADESRETTHNAYARRANAFTSKPESYAGWKEYVRQLRMFWFEFATLPTLWFDNETNRVGN